MKPNQQDVVSTASGLHPEQRVVDHLRLAGMDQRRSLLVLRHDGKWSRLDPCSLLFVWLPAT